MTRPSAAPGRRLAAGPCPVHGPVEPRWWPRIARWVGDVPVRGTARWPHCPRCYRVIAGGAAAPHRPGCPCRACAGRRRRRRAPA